MAIDACSRPVESLRIEVPAAAERLAEIRRKLTGWLKPIGMSSSRIADIVLVVNEACTNCIEHAYRDIIGGRIRIDAVHDKGQIVVDIADDGVWQTPPTQPSTRGRGLSIMRAVSTGVDVNSSTKGTTVRMRFAAP
ncbi:anti-sigma regulatory factor [Mycolicibacterium moriokaense]|uniref:ATP-binding protein n=1 Tax=Mycolicibacterium moriokaense TaxID=39691 RepID=UPI0009F6F027|nr:ATP-binding protein [Mycolicibacterium moriokaense]MCV7039007.1 ATP-binding protein [Mycolicibacterium moriokaense]ORB20398.1 anti-sigma regulatory factor [Mycolicibacterium moriokaense]